MKTLLLIAGVAQIGLALAHLAFPRRLQWKEEAARMSRLNEQMFHVHTFFVCLTLALFGAWTLILADAMVRGEQRWLSGGIALFWFCRLLAQIFVYDSALWRGKRFETSVHILFLLLWCFLSGIYTVAALH
jgi:membrane protein YdbS with pleckstrin-like domain